MLVRGRCGGGGAVARFRAAELLGVVGPEKTDQELVGEPALESDEFPAVEDRLRDAVTLGDGPGLFVQTEPVLLVDGRKGLAVGFGDAEGVVVEFAGDAGPGGGDSDDAVGSVGSEEGLLLLGQWLRHGAVPVADADPSAHAGFACASAPEKRLECQVCRSTGVVGRSLPAAGRRAGSAPRLCASVFPSSGRDLKHRETEDAERHRGLIGRGSHRRGSAGASPSRREMQRNTSPGAPYPQPQPPEPQPPPPPPFGIATRPWAETGWTSITPKPAAAACSASFVHSGPRSLRT
ncbi:hypothetical protein VT03_14855 [Planctomyces sp. SH-PL14]|nr:hypothetical protein VT03_14855 [Planctomyces sp. SH-PL14]